MGKSTKQLLPLSIFDVNRLRPSVAWQLCFALDQDLGSLSLLSTGYQETQPPIPLQPDIAQFFE